MIRMTGTCRKAACCRVTGILPSRQPSRASAKEGRRSAANRVLRAIFLLACLSAAGGCGGNYTVTAPDLIAPAGGEGVAVVRLRRYEVLMIPAPVQDAAVRLQVADEIERGAYTDKLGYAGTTVPVPAEPGLYTLKISHMDAWGDEVFANAKAYVWDANAPTVAVDLDSLPGLGRFLSKSQGPALREAVRGANVVYLTRTGAKSHPWLHLKLKQAGYPDGPILEWQRQYWHIVRDGKYYNMPRVIVESRLVSQLPDLRKMLPGLTVGICDGRLAAKAFGGSGMKVVVVGGAGVEGDRVVRRASWADLAQKGI